MNEDLRALEAYVLHKEAARARAAKLEGEMNARISKRWSKTGQAAARATNRLKARELAYKWPPA